MMEGEVLIVIENCWDGTEKEGELPLLIRDSSVLHLGIMSCHF